MSKYLKLFRENIDREIASKGWSQNRLAEELKVASGDLSDWLSGKVALKFDRACVIAEKAGWSLLRPAEADPKVRNEQRSLNDEWTEQSAGGEAANPKNTFKDLVLSQSRGEGATNNHQAEKRDVNKGDFHTPYSETSFADLMGEFRALREEIHELKALVRQPKRPELMQPFSEAVTLLSNMEEHELRSALNQMVPIGKGRVPGEYGSGVLGQIILKLRNLDESKLPGILQILTSTGHLSIKGKNLDRKGR